MAAVAQISRRVTGRRYTVAMGQLQEDLAELEQLTPLERVLAAARLMDAHRDAIAALAQVRSDAVAELRRQGMSLAAIASGLEVSRQQVHRLEHATKTRS